MPKTPVDLPLIKVVGISAAGKSTLVRGLRQHGYDARPASQEHSGTPDMWQRIRPPAVLIFLEIDEATQKARRPDVQWTANMLEIERHRLRHAREHADHIMDTGQRAATEILNETLSFLQRANIQRADQPLPPLPGTGSSTPDLSPFPESESEE